MKLLHHRGTKNTKVAQRFFDTIPLCNSVPFVPLCLPAGRVNDYL
jgi:hypothetical protein